MRKFSAIDWQSFSLKKDIEDISRKLGDNHAIQLTLLGEIALAFTGAALPNIFTEIEKERCFWISLCILCLSPIVLLIIRMIRIKVKRNKPGADRMTPRDFINAFDNEIEYYTFMSESYCTILLEAISSNEAMSNRVDINVLHFNYIQASYYFKKAIADLAPINNIADKVLSRNIDEIIEKRLISLPRYINIKNVLSDIYECLLANKGIVSNSSSKLEDAQLILDSNKKFKESLDAIDRSVIQILKISNIHKVT